MQETQVEALGWDEEQLDHLKVEWKSWFGELGQLDEIFVPRCLKEDEKERDVTIHTFCDASEKAYSAATYTRHKYEEESVSTQLVAAKTRMAHRKSTGIPHLELIGALTGLSLTKQIVQHSRFLKTKSHFGGQCEHWVLDPRTELKLEAYNSLQCAVYSLQTTTLEVCSNKTPPCRSRDPRSLTTRISKG